MKPEVMVGVLAVIVAMVLYSIGVWGAYRSKRFSQRNVMFILVGVVFDVIATGAMFVAAGNTFQFDTTYNIVHTTIALLGFFGMLAVGLVGIWGVQKSKDELLAGLSRWALAPWALWAVSFVLGLLRPRG
jgi:uncharacterized membrane protein YiaA